MESTELSLPPELPYPIIISSLDLHAPAEISRGVRLLTYSFTYVSLTNGASEVRFGTWDSPVEGTIHSWKIKPGDTISQKRSLEPVVSITEPCKHGMQVGGLCGLCGKDMTDFDYTGFSNAARANIQMTHSARGPTVSLEEAQRFERETAAHLLKSRKLSLIVDLDQTIVHATVDPTVGEWITEGEAWETRRAQGGEQGGEQCSEENVSPSDVNPNWEALKDVKKFRLATEGVAPRMPPQPRLDAQGCMYYIKPRPGLTEFLNRMSEKYEMHVYTMGTRAYAEAVCATIDSNGTIFRDRLLSRDESGSLTQKSLQRLFPCDTSMVVIIDDRADVWEWSPNLLKVRPYDFFVGIGDINSISLPKAPSLLPATSPDRDCPPESTEDVSSLSYKAAKAEAETAFASQNRITIERIVAQVEERPLAKKQEELEDGSKVNDKATEATVAVNGERTGTTEAKIEMSAPPKKALLKNDDTELIRVSGLLDEVHKRFFEAYDTRLPDTPSKLRKTPLLGDRSAPTAVPYDVRAIIPRLRAETLAGAHLVFSSVIPLDVDPPTSEIWRTAEVFGATCHTSLSSQVTHVVAAKRGTAKVDAARRRGGIHIVWLSWFLDSLALWRRQDETSYLINGDASTTGTPRHTSCPPQEAMEEDVGDGGELITPDADIWADANAEVDAVLEETDDEDEVASIAAEDYDSDSGWRTDGSEASSAVASPSSATVRNKKRRRSASVSDSDGSLSVSRASSRNEEQKNETQSPLAKRKKIAAARQGSSRLKVGHVVGDLPAQGVAAGAGAAAAAAAAGRDESDEEANEDMEGNRDGEVDSEGPLRGDRDSIASTDGHGDDSDDYDGDDFLARALEEEGG